MKRLFFLALFLGYSLISLAQPLSAYTNFQNQFYVWDNGYVRKIEYLVPVKTAIGRSAIGYLDNSRSFKIYHRGGATKINDGFTNSIYATDNLIGYKNTNSLFVWENGKITQLSGMVGDFKIGDSVVLFFDGIQSQYEAYYNGEIYPIEGFLGGTSSEYLFAVDTSRNISISNSQSIESGQLPSAKASDNIAAYVNYAGQFRIFFHGNIIDQEPYLVKSFDVGRNTVAYVDINAQFRVFHNSNTRLLDDFPPENYAAGDDLVAYVGSDNNFKIFYNDSVYTIGYFQPNFTVGDHVVAFEDGSGYFKVFYKGTVYTLESYYPDDYVVAYNSVAYVNRANVLRQFCEGDIFDVTNAGISQWRLDYDVVQYRFGTNLYKVFYKGRTY